MVDTGDLKSPACKGVRVRVSFKAKQGGRSSAPLFCIKGETRNERRHSRQKAPVERFERRRGSGASSLVQGKRIGSDPSGCFRFSFMEARLETSYDKKVWNGKSKVFFFQIDMVVLVNKETEVR